MRTDTELLDWLSKQSYVHWKEHYNSMVDERTPKEKETGGFNGYIDFFTCHSQHLDNYENLRAAINTAMDMKSKV
jgi:hypothetical protein